MMLDDQGDEGLLIQIGCLELKLVSVYRGDPRVITKKVEIDSSYDEYKKNIDGEDNEGAVSTKDVPTAMIGKRPPPKPFPFGAVVVKGKLFRRVHRLARGHVLVGTISASASCH